MIQSNLTYFAQNVLVLRLFTKDLDQVSYKCDVTILHVCGMMRVLIDMQICYSDVVHRAKQKETERVLQRCVKIVQKFIHLYSQNLRYNVKKLRKLIFWIPSFCFSTIPSKRIIKTILRHVVEKQTVDSDITEILETLSAFATVLERWTVNDKICVQCVAQIIQYISVVFSQNSTLATPHRAVFFQVVYICLRLVRVVDSTMKSFTSRSSRQNERIGGNLLPSLRPAAKLAKIRKPRDSTVCEVLATILPPLRVFASLLHFRREQRLATAIDRQGQKRKRPVDVLALLPRHLLLVAAVDRRVGD